MNIPRDTLPFAELSAADQYKLLSVAVQPRPIAWVSTTSADGSLNLAPFSFFTVASRSPATLLISVGERDGVPGLAKDTLANARATGEFVVNIPSLDSADAVAASSEQVAPGIDEFDLAGVSPIPSRIVRPPSVAEALLSLECALTQEVRVGTDVVLFGEVVAVTTRAGLVDDRIHVDIYVHQFLGRLAGPFFTSPDNRVPQRSGIGVSAAPGQRAGGQR